MLQTRIQQVIDSLREGLVAGFISGLLVVFLILLGIPIRIQNLALFSLLLVVFIFGVRVARRLRGRSTGDLLRNTLAMGLLAALITLLFMALINSWQARGIDVRRYFDAINLDTMTVLSGVPKEELGPNPPRDPLTGAYPEGAVLRTNPLALTFGTANGLHLQLGLAGSSWFDINLGIGGLYGFALLLVVVGVAAGLIARGVAEADLGRHRKRATSALAGHPLAHWGVLLLPLIFFGLLWLTKGQGGRGPLIALGGSSQEIQLLISFGIVLWALVAVRAAQPNDWGLNYPARLAVCLAVIGGLLALGIWRIVDSRVYFMATSESPNGSARLSVLVAVVLALVVALQNAFALRAPGRFELQLAGTQSALVLLLMPLFLDQYQNDVMTLVGINILLGLGLNIVVGYAGLLDLGYVAFFALGAYAYAFLSSNQQEFDEKNNPIGLKFAGNDEMVVRLAGWIVIAVIVTALVTVVGMWVWRRRQASRPQEREARLTLVDLPSHPGGNVTFALTSVAILISLIAATLLQDSGLYQDLFNNASPFLLGMVVGVIVSGLSGIALGIPVLRLRGDYLAIVTLGFGEIIRLMFTNLRDFTGGPQGVLQIPRPIPQGATGTVTYLSMVYLVFLGAALVAFFSMRLKNSRTGRAWSAMCSDEDIAQSMGINLVQSKLTAFAIGAAFAGIGGVLFAARQRNIFPGDFKLDVSIEVLSLVIIGGMGSIPGVIMGAIALIGVPEVLRELATYRVLAFGALLVVMVIIRPKGLLPTPPAQLQARARALLYGQSESRGSGEGQA